MPRGFLSQPSAPVDEAFRRWIATHPCVVEGCENVSVCCHFRNKRMWGDVGNCWPGCHDHHHEQHQHGIKTFQAKYQLDLDLVSAVYGEAWIQRLADNPPF